MPTTTSLKLPDALKAAVDDALVRQQFYADGGVAYQGAIRSNAAFGGADVKAYVLARAAGGKPGRPQALCLDATKPMAAAHD
jgi:hypothetical protein